MYDELIIQIRQLQHWFKPNESECFDPYEILEKAADAIEELTAELEYTKRQYDLAVEDLEKIGWGEWIPVTERLPEKWKRVLTYQKEYGVTENNICGDGENWRIGYHITHWMPLPEKPESEGE